MTAVAGGFASETFAGRPRDPQQLAALRAAAQGVLVAVVTAKTPIVEALAGRSAGAAVASVVSGVGRGARRFGAGVAVAYTWASLETGASVRVFAGIAAVAALAAVPSRLTARVAVAVATLGGLTLIAVGHTAGAVRDVVDQGLRDIYAVAPPFVWRRTASSIPS